MSKENFPLIIGAAQYTQRKGTFKPLDPLNLAIKVSWQALNDVKGTNLRELIDSVYMININSWSYEDAPAELSNKLEIKPKYKVYLPDGGNTPQMLINRAAKEIAAGNSKAILIVGAEAEYSAYIAKKKNLKLNWPPKKQPKYMEGELWDGICEFENQYYLKTPPYTYALFETAIRARSGRSIDAHRIHIGKLFEHFSKIASKNPYSWTQKFYTAEEIIKPSPENRIICHPYTKRMCSNMFVDQAAAVIITNENIADNLKIKQNLRVYLMGCADLKNVHKLTERPKLYDAPATKEGSKLALNQAGLKIQDIDKFDIYSCFPSIVQIIKNELGLSENDPRDLTITGGLPYFGGPWSNFSMHSIVSAINMIRKNPSLKIMIVANGGYNSKQSIGIYGNKPPRISFTENNNEMSIQNSILKNKLPPPVEIANGVLVVDAYTIIYDRQGQPVRGIVIGSLKNGRRTLAFIIAKQKILQNLVKQELVGKAYEVYYDSEIKRNVVKLGDF
ncbi:MAG: hypothetical protein ACTSQS_12310 [Promethearchaeota archaeon]